MPMNGLRCFGAFWMSVCGACSPPIIEVSFSGDGRGQVAAGMNRCSSACKLSGDLIAEPDENSEFVGWSGGCSGTGTCRPTTTTVTASFRAINFPVVVRTSGEGTIRTEAGALPAAKAIRVGRDQRVTLVAEPGPGWLFSRWEADCEGQSEPGSCLLLVAKPLEVLAVFERGLEVSVVVNGPGVVEAPAPIGTCSARCQGLVRAGTTLNFVAQPNANATFLEWTNGCFNQSSCSLTITDPVTLTATFNADVTLRTAGDGTGRVNLPGCAEGTPCRLPWRGNRINFGTVAGPNSRFRRFTGCPIVNGKFCTVDRAGTEVSVEFEKIVLSSSILGGVIQATILEAADAEYLWVNHERVATVNGVSVDRRSNGSPVWTLFRTQGSQTTAVMTPTLSSSFVRGDVRPDGGISSLITVGQSWDAGLAVLDSFDEAVVATDARGAIEWVQPLRGRGVFVRDLVVDQRTSTTWFLGTINAIDQDPPVTLTVGANSVTSPPVSTPPQSQLKRSFVGSIDSRGQPVSLVLGLAAASLDQRLFMAETGPIVFTTTFTSPQIDTASGAGSNCLQNWQTPASSVTNFYWSLTRPSACGPQVFWPQSDTSGSVLNLKGFVAQPGGFTLLGYAFSPGLQWTGTALTGQGAYLSHHLGTADPQVREFLDPTCGPDLFIAEVVAADADTLFIGARGACIPDIESSAEAAFQPFVARYDVRTKRVVSGWRAPYEGNVLSMARLNEREVRVVFGFVDPIRIDTTDYPAESTVMITVRP